MQSVNTSQAALSVASGPNIGYVLSDEQFPITQLVQLGEAAERAGFDAVWSSDHFQPWQDNEGHSAFAWLTLAAVGQRTRNVIMGTGVTVPIYRYRPAIVAQGFASLGLLYPGRIFLGVGTGEAINEEAATGESESSKEGSGESSPSGGASAGEKSKTPESSKGGSESAGSSPTGGASAP